VQSTFLEARGHGSYHLTGLRQPQSYEVVCWNMQKELSLTSFFYFTLRGADLLLFYARSIRVEATKLLSLLPCEDTIGPMLVLCRWHLILVDG
jgi:hypothetical protein